MYSLGISPNSINSCHAVIPQVKHKSVSLQNSCMQNPVGMTTPSFRADQPASAKATPVPAPAPAKSVIRTQLASSDEHQKYSAVAGNLDSKGRKELNHLLKNGILLNTNSNDKTSTLDNLYKIVSEPRAKGLDPKVVLSETVATIANPFKINQHFEAIPTPLIPTVVKAGNENMLNSPHGSAMEKDEINSKTVNVEHSGDCVAASIEFNLAKQMPAEFARFAAGLTSPNVSVEKTIESKNLANNTLDTVWLLNAFEVPYKMDNFDSAKLTLAPDKNALIRAQVQNYNSNPNQRSLIDTLMQATFMNVGSQQTYNSLTDKRSGKFSQDNSGLVEFEKTFTESVVEDKNKISVTYQILDENGKLVGYETDYNTIKKQLLDSLAMGENIIIGYTYWYKDKNNPSKDANDEVLGGHEITITGAKKDKDGNVIFICNDTDDYSSKPIEYKEDYIIPKIHHAGLPQKVAEQDVQYVDNWVEGMNAYKDAKKQEQEQNKTKAA